MTHQTSEYIVHQGQSYATTTKPLDTYFAMGGKRPPIIVNCTASWRGYSGTWSLDDGRLRLTGIRGLLALGALVKVAGRLYGHSAEYRDDPNLCRDLVLEDIFPGFPHQVFAHWYSGEIHGEAIEKGAAGIIAVIEGGCVRSVRHADIGGKRK